MRTLIYSLIGWILSIILSALSYATVTVYILDLRGSYDDFFGTATIATISLFFQLIYLPILTYVLLRRTESRLKSRINRFQVLATFALIFLPMNIITWQLVGYPSEEITLHLTLNVLCSVIVFYMIHFWHTGEVR